MRYEWYIAKRYLQPQGGATFIFHLTLISMAGVALGVTSLIVVLSVMNGFANDLREKMIEGRSHAVMYYHQNSGLANYREALTEFAKIDNIEACSPVIMKYGFLYPADYRNPPQCAVHFSGIDVKLESAVSGIDKKIIAGSLDPLANEIPGPPSNNKIKLTDLAQDSTPSQESGIVIGKELATELFYVMDTPGLSDKETYGRVIGQRLTLVTIPVEGDSIMSGATVDRTFTIVGVFEFGHYDFDRSFVYISLAAAQYLLDIPDCAREIQFRLKQFDETSTENTFQRILTRNSELTGTGVGQTWMGMNQIFFEALKIEKHTMDTILKIIILVATFNIIATLFMIVMEKTRDIGLLRAMGAGRKNIMLIFLILGIIVGILGAVLGVMGGLTICRFIQIFKIAMPGDNSIYYLKYVPCDMEFWDFLWVCVYTVSVSFLASIYPAVRASRLTPVDALRHS